MSLVKNLVKICTLGPQNPYGEGRSLAAVLTVASQRLGFVKKTRCRNVGPALAARMVRGEELKW